MARYQATYNMVWYPAPDSYSATNAATASAFVLSESYLYTTNAIVDGLQHLTPDGIFVAQFGEFDYKDKPNRTARYVATARQALTEIGVADAPRPHPGGDDSPAHFFGSFTLVDDHREPGALHPRRGEPLRGVTVGSPGDDPAVRPGPCRHREPRRHGGLVDSRAQLRAFYSSYRYNVGADHRQRAVFLALRPLRLGAARLPPPHHDHRPRGPGR